MLGCVFSEERQRSFPRWIHLNGQNICNAVFGFFVAMALGLDGQNSTGSSNDTACDKKEQARVTRTTASGGGAGRRRIRRSATEKKKKKKIYNT